MSTKTVNAIYISWMREVTLRGNEFAYDSQVGVLRLQLGSLRT